ncbi:MAG: DUF5606 domain-containing protein [Bacteroidales bacterium]|jgi:hypothetical protein|nr:DUF5606 domain-containing protein [Bacteroidales bacterium]MDD3329990.1 DUF5606 domain-containing protein [Bacteroidales bacterium]MDD3690661.1 DUF5606 domain-containing protein [Bacteroidales bacterium]MDD4580801.1 DUF5606 domain-containing protein [Bacteroidales bacterium]MDX9890377.1 DUF5606 domain-containing protein [Bacteroidales bacterium]
MDLKKILSISGKSGLYQIVVQSKDRVIVESLLDRTRIPVYPTHKVSSLEDISIFTDSNEIPLKEVLKKIYTIENGGNAIDPKSDSNALKAYMSKILPDYDQNKVYISDMKKLFAWYNSLLENKLLSFEEKESNQETEETSFEEQ